MGVRRLYWRAADTVASLAEPDSRFHHLLKKLKAPGKWNKSSRSVSSVGPVDRGAVSVVHAVLSVDVVSVGLLSSVMGAAVMVVSLVVEVVRLAWLWARGYSEHMFAHIYVLSPTRIV